MWCYTPPTQVDAKRHFDDFHQPHQGNKDEGDDEATQKLLSLLFVFHAEVLIKNCSAAKVGNFGRTPTIPNTKIPLTNSERDSLLKFYKILIKENLIEKLDD